MGTFRNKRWSEARDGVITFHKYGQPSLICNFRSTSGTPRKFLECMIGFWEALSSQILALLMFGKPILAFVANVVRNQYSGEKYANLGKTRKIWMQLLSHLGASYSPRGFDLGLSYLFQNRIGDSVHFTS